ncbi:XdhC family protein [Opitutales bacterium ASA1]|uniref:XdhC family protein n=1 Tax=Congregicoccus parvus TaxID=3081749 RepID=UPI002B2DB616|nr:XdhC family protein [Opitutales bacterium ASA1]
MHELLPRLGAWMDEGAPFALATVTRVDGSAPRLPGACMAVRPEENRFLGSVSSGCLDAEIVHAARETLVDGEPRLLRFGPDASTPWVAGLTCGGWVDVTVEPWWGLHLRPEVRAIAREVRAWFEHDLPGVVLSAGRAHLAVSADGGRVGDRDAFSADLISDALGTVQRELPSFSRGSDSDRVFIRSIRRRPRLLLVGAVDIAARLVGLARETGFRTTVIDPRSAYMAPDRFREEPNERICKWPQEPIAGSDLGPRDAAVVLTHDPKIDDPALLALLRTRVGYVGALGSRKSHAERLERLEATGETTTSLARISGPAGLHLGTPDAAGIAVGILAGILQWQAAAERERRRIETVATK